MYVMTVLFVYLRSIRHGVIWGAIALVLAAASATAAETLIQAAGTGSATPLIEELAKAYGRKAPGIQIKVLMPPMGSSAAVRAVMAGAIDLAFSGKPLGGSEKDKGGQDIELGATPFLIVTREVGRMDNVNSERLAEIYSGQVTAWPDGSTIRLELRSPQESDTLLLRALSPAMDKAMGLALSRSGFPVAANDLDNVALLEKTPGSLGMSSLALLTGLKSDLHPVPLNGVAPTLSNLEKGLYPHDKPLYLVLGPHVSDAARGFVEFARSAEGRKVLAKQGYIPAKLGQ
jgi:phosphate transport system substrate-binding protein